MHLGMGRSPARLRWIGWASGNMPPHGKGSLADHQRAEDLLRKGYAVSGLRDRDAIAEWLQLVRDWTEHAGSV